MYRRSTPAPPPISPERIGHSIVDDARFERIAELLKALTELSKHGEELRAELAAEIEKAHGRAVPPNVSSPDRRALNRRRRKRRASD